MKFGEFVVDGALGLVLAHAIKLPDGALPKGHVLQASDLQRLKAAGQNRVMAARIDEEDMGEDEAALILSHAMAAEHVRLSRATTGRANLYSTVDGVFAVDKSIVDRLNTIDPAITFACLSDHARVNAGDMVATFKIIPLAVHRRKIDEACELLRKAAAITIRPFAQFAVSLIATELPHLKPAVMDKTAQTLARRLMIRGNQVVREIRVSHDTESLAKALRIGAATCEAVPKLIIVFGASAVIDSCDVIPQAIRDAGGDVLRVGMPVDPGNLMVLGTIGSTYVIGAPGCARSPKENGFDWILDRILTGENPDELEIGRMGVGGLLIEIPTRPMPREARDKTVETSVAIVLLAAGMARRMGNSGFHKLLAEFDGVPLIRQSAMAALNSDASSVTVVVGHRREEIEKKLADLQLNVVVNHDYASGMAGSLAVGFATAASRAVGGILVMLADMPGVSSDDLNRLIATFRQADGMSIVRAVAHGKRGNPVILPLELYDAVLRLEGDVGARHIVEMSGLPVINVELGDAARLDVDTAAAVIATGGIPGA